MNCNYSLASRPLLCTSRMRQSLDGDFIEKRKFGNKIWDISIKHIFNLIKIFLEEVNNSFYLPKKKFGLEDMKITLMTNASQHIKKKKLKKILELRKRKE